MSVEIKKKFEGDKWTIKVVSFKEMKKAADGDECTSGLCVAHDRTLYLREDSVDFETICHEVTHAYFSYLCLSATEDISLHDAEEIFCEFLSKKGESVIKTAKQITKTLIKKIQEEE